EELFEVVVGNPPFGGAAEAEHDVYLAWQYHWWRLGARRKAGLPRELWFLERSLRLLKPQGLLAMVLPEGLLANRRWRAQREVLVRDCQIEAVVGLPRSVFSRGGAAVKTVLLVLRKCRPAPGHQVRLAELDASELAQASATLLAEWQQGRSLASERPWG
ncbi:MAG: N-6 DNA methylase, partial [Armatimonadota bacterium]